mmetsp:Transcript_3419/g.2876  ORF Transcript_3419/g.2876 Transcript_3419/m.2876 type:complete len:88 (-) Transcript_3419:17-280(-)
MYLPRGFWLFTWTFGIFSGVAFSAIRTGYYGLEQLDKLGKDYELSRVVKQDIFDTRPDVDSDIRALYYMKQAKEADAAEENFNENRR